MNDEEKQKMREIFIKILQDEYGVNHETFEMMKPLLREYDCHDIVRNVHSSGDRCFLPMTIKL